MVKQIQRYLKYFYYIYYFIGMSKVNMSLSRAAATSALRDIDYTNPLSWEFSGFSQSGGDGIIDILTRKLLSPNRYFIEIGANDGIENNTAWLAFARRYTGIMVDGNPKLSWRCNYLLSPLCLIDTINLFVNKDNIDVIKNKALYINPDVFSIDIDGIDYYVVEAFLKFGFRPKIIVVEYNSAFGPSESITIEYRENIYPEREKGRFPVVYWGCSLNGWKTLLLKHGVDAFFIDPGEFSGQFIKQLKKGIDFRDNFSTFWFYKNSWDKQFNLMKDLPFFKIR